MKRGDILSSHSNLSSRSKSPLHSNLSVHSDRLEKIIMELNTDAVRGLTAGEAAERLITYGPNKLDQQKKQTIVQRFIEQFKDVMIMILIAAAAVSFFVAYAEGESYIESLLIILVVVLNAIMGVVQESKAEKALDALKDMSAPQARVIRNGQESVLAATDLVPGDIIMVEAGDFIPADGRLLEGASLKTDESSLTGESLPVEKNEKAEVQADAPLGDRYNMLYSGCAVTYGRGRLLVTGTGMNTEMGQIATLLASSKAEATPLQVRLAALGKYLGIAALLACAVIFLIGILEGMPVMDIFMISVSLAVSAIPEGLPAIVTIVLAIGVQRMVKQNAIIRRLPAVETLGSASVICSDKTGTLTQNVMTVTDLFAARSEMQGLAEQQGATEVQGIREKIGDNNSEPVKKLLVYAALCCDAKIIYREDMEERIGDPTETAIIAAAFRNGLTQEALDRLYPREGELPFDSDRKLMTTINLIEGRHIVIVKGAFDVLAGRCRNGIPEAARQENDRLGAEALRVLAVARKELEQVPETLRSEELESGLIFMGLLGMIDPPRQEARDAIAICKGAGIKTVMITGDHAVTAGAIAAELGIRETEDEVVTGTELEGMSEEELNQRVRHISVYARVTPADKIRIVRAWQSQGEVVAMTGDGVNDGPALKAADIGCAMGITGTDVAKGAAAMTLADDNFATIVEAVREGRGIYDNIRKVVAFLLGTNIGEILTVFFAMILWRQSPLLSMQLLWINLVTDSLPAVALGMEAVEKDVMNRAPKPKDEGVFANGLGLQIILQGIMFALLTLTGFYLGWIWTGSLDTGRTMAFIVLAMSQIFHAYNMRSARSLLGLGVFSNSYLTGATFISSLLVAAILFIPPVTAAFGLTSLTLSMYGLALGLAFVPIPVLELCKVMGFIR